MTGKKKRIIAIAVLVAVAAGIFFYVRVPGTAIRGLRDVSPEHSRVRVTMGERFFDYNDRGQITTTQQKQTEFDLDAGQIEMLRDFLLRSVFIRSPERNVRTGVSGGRTATYIIQFFDTDLLSNMLIDQHGYIHARISRADRLRPLRIVGSGWEDALLEILAMTPENRVTVRD